MRKNYGKILGKKLWEQNIEVKLRGSGSSTIRLISGMFANNKNKKDIFNAMKNELNMLRFQRAEFLWYKLDDEYTYWTLKNPKDTEIK